MKAISFADTFTSVSNELACKIGDLTENSKLAYGLKVVKEERYIFMSSMLGLLAEYCLWPLVVNTSAITNSVKYQHDQLKWKIKETFDEGKPNPIEFRNDEVALRQKIYLEHDCTAIHKIYIDDEHANATVWDPKILLMTSRDPSAPFV